MRKKIVVLLIALLSGTIQCISAQDSIPRHKYAPFSRAESSRWLTTTATGAGALAIGAISRWAMDDNIVPSRYSKDPGTGLADAAQYAPLAFPWIMKAFGVPTRSSWGVMAVSHAIGTVIMAGTVESIKRSSKYPRPDGSDMRSFPSGHSAWAFLGATVTARELGWRSPWYTLGAYAFASGVAMQRVIDRRHLPCDVVAGAGIGILAAQAGYYLGDIISGGKRPSHHVSDTRTSGTAATNPAISLETGLLFHLNAIHVGNKTIHQRTALSTGIKGDVPISDRWSAGAKLAIRSTPVFLAGENADIYISPLNSVGGELSASFHLPISSTVNIMAEAAGGFYKNFRLKSSGRSIDAGSGNATGRISTGAEWSISDEMRIGASAGYEISGYKYSLSTDATYGITSPASKSGIDQAITLNISSSISF